MKPDEIKLLRQSLAISQAQLSSMLGVTPATIAHWEAGRSIPPPVYTSIMIKLREKVSRKGKTEELTKALFGVLLAGGIVAFLDWIFSREEPKKHQKKKSKVK